jgi:hypothetical protein
MTDKHPSVEVCTVQVASSPAQTPSFSDVVARIRQDSVEESQQYLDETNVPHGGE